LNRIRYSWLCATALVWCPALLPAAASTNSIPVAGPPAVASNSWTEVKTDEMDGHYLNPRAKALLQEAGDKWRHAQTPHYVVHFSASEGDLFAHKVALQSEFFYNYISKDLGDVQDLYPNRSHIFTFRNEYRWKKFLKTVPTVDPWAYSFVMGAVMFLQQAENTKTGAHVLAHETTHLVVNRFIGGSPPLWLNEGVAEYYGEFGLSEYRGLKRYAGSVFKGLREPMPLERLFAIVKYPGDRKEVDRLYETSKYFVGFLMTKKPHDRFCGFLKDMAEKDALPLDALKKHYDFPDLDTVQKEFTHFCH